MSTVIGVDLAGSPEYGARRPGRVGLAALTADLQATVQAGRLTDAEILEFVRSHGGILVAIDAPLSLPKGRCCADTACPCARYGIVRAVDRILARQGYRPYWPLMASMRPVTLRGIALKRLLEGRGIPVIEVFPGAAQDVLGLPRKQHGQEVLARSLRETLGIRGAVPTQDGDILDALTAAYTGWLHVRGRTRGFGPPDEVQVFVPW